MAGSGSPRPAVVYLIGYPGAGKLTIATELARLARLAGEQAGDGQRMVVVDNHHVHNTIFAVLDTGGRGIPQEAWDLVLDVRRAVVRAIETLSPPGWSFVFTNVLVAGHPLDERAVANMAALAERRQSAFVPVRILCHPDELARRVVSPRRRERLKWADADGIRAFVTEHQLVALDEAEHGFDLDVTDLPAAAELIYGRVVSAAAG